jgi:hypothetical protein
VNAFKILADDQTKEIGFIVSGSWIETDDMALPLQDAQVLSRFGEQNYIPLHNLNETEAEEFMKSLLSEWVDAERRTEITQKFGTEAEGEEIRADSFPYTVAGLASAAKYATRQGGYTTPRDIQKTLDDFSNRAIDDGRHILSSAYLTSLING